MLEKEQSLRFQKHYFQGVAIHRMVKKFFVIFLMKYISPHNERDFPSRIPEEAKNNHSSFLDSPLEESLPCDEIEDCSGATSNSEETLFICFFL